MAKKNIRLLRALCFSIACHAALLWGSTLHFALPPAPPSPLEAHLVPPKTNTNKMPSLLLPKKEKSVAKPAKKPSPNPKRAPKVKERQENSVLDWQKSLKTQFKKQQEEGLYYPEAAIAQGLEGDVLVLMILDEEGKVVAARIEQSSGHALLDQAAIRAVRALKSLPSNAPRDVILPLRFRLSP